MQSVTQRGTVLLYRHAAPRISDCRGGTPAGHEKEETSAAAVIESSQTLFRITKIRLFDSQPVPPKQVEMSLCDDSDI
jgi:hypothetical protein